MALGQLSYKDEKSFSGCHGCQHTSNYHSLFLKLQIMWVHDFFSAWGMSQEQRHRTRRMIAGSTNRLWKSSHGQQVEHCAMPGEQECGPGCACLAASSATSRIRRLTESRRGPLGPGGALADLGPVPASRFAALLRF